MKIVIVGSEKTNTLEFFLTEGMRKCGVNPLSFPARDMAAEKLEGSLINKVQQRLFPSKFYARVNRDLRSFVRENQPDVVLVFKGMELMPSTIKKLKSHCKLLAIYNPDHPYIYSDRGSGNAWMSASVSDYDLFFTYTEEIKEQLASNDVRAEVVPFGYYLPDEWKQKVLDEKEEKKICFLGNGDERRTQTLNELSRSGIPLVVYGNNWEYGLDDQIDLKSNAYDLDFWRVMRKYRGQINIMRDHNLNSHNMRTFDIPAIGGIQIAPDTPDHQKFFTENKEILLYRDMDELRSQCERVLDMTESDAKDFRFNAMERSVNSGYSYDQRAEDMLEMLNKFLA